MTVDTRRLRELMERAKAASEAFHAEGAGIDAWRDAVHACEEYREAAVNALPGLLDRIDTLRDAVELARRHMPARDVVAERMPYAASLLADIDQVDDALGAAPRRAMPPTCGQCGELRVYCACKVQGPLVEDRIERWRDQEGGREDEDHIELLMDAEEELRRLRHELGEREAHLDRLSDRLADRAAIAATLRDTLTEMGCTVEISKDTLVIGIPKRILGKEAWATKGRGEG